MALDKEDCTCPVCMCIMIEPVTMPCKHSLCMACYKQTVEKANLCCPICRVRISVWARRATKMNSLVDTVKWDAIKNLYPKQVQNRLEGKENVEDILDSSEDYETQLRRLKELSKPGEIRQEYEATLQKLQHQRQEETKVEEEASAALINALQQEEERERENMERLRKELDKLDEEIAEQLQESFEVDAALAEPETSNRPFTLSRSGNKTPGGFKKGKSKHVKQPVSNSLTLTTFFSPVSRGGDVTDLKYKQDSRSHDVGSCKTVTDSSLPSFFHDKLSCKQSQQALTSQAGGNFGEGSRWRKNLDSSLSTIASDLNIETSDSKGNKINTSSTGELYQKMKPQSKFIADPSGLGTSHERDGSLNNLASFTGKGTHLPVDASHHVRLTERDHTIELQPLVRCTKLLSEQVASGSVSDFSCVLTETGNSLPHELKSISCETVSTTTRFRSSQPSHRDTANEIPDSSDQLQDQCLQKLGNGDRCDVGSRSDSILSCGNSGTVVNKTCTESNKCSSLSQDHDIVNHKTMLTTLALTHKHDSDSEHEISLGKTSEVQKENINESLMHVISETPADRLDIGNKKMNLCSGGSVISASSESEKINNNDINNDLSNCDSFNGRSNGDSTVIPPSRDVINNDSNRSCDNDEHLVAAGGDRCAFISSRSFPNNTDTFKNHSKVSLPGIETIYSPEKENTIVKTDPEQTSHKSTKSEIEQGHNIPVKVFKHRKMKQKTRKSKNLAVSSVKEGNAEPVVSIMRWCVSNKGRDEPESAKDDVITDKTGLNKNKNVFGCPLKRLYSSSSDCESEQIMYDTKQMSGVQKCTREADGHNDISSSVRKKSTNDKVIDSSSSSNQAASLDYLCSDDADQNEMTQEEKDHLFALKLQEMYTKLDKSKITVDRFKGSKDQYQLRKKRRGK